MTVYGKLRQAKQGQGVIEYSGALVIAAVIVAGGLIVIPPSFASLIDTIFTTMGTFLASHMPT